MSRGDSAVTAGAGNSDSGEARRLHDWVRAGRSFSGGERHCLFRNTGDGRFEDLSAVSGLDLADDGRAAALTDWDADGDLDLWVANRSAPQLRYLENGKPPASSSLQLQLVGSQCNRDAIGARATLSVAGTPPQTRELGAGSGFLTQSSKTLHFGLGDAQSADLAVHWPGGESQHFSDLAPGRYRIVQGEAPRKISPDPRPTLPAKPAAALPASERLRVFSATRIPLPKLAYTTFDGETRSIPPKPERPLLLNLWASWCQPCAAELAGFADAEAEFSAAGVDVLALSVDVDSDLGAAKSLLDKSGFRGPSGRAPERTTELLQMANNRLFDRHRVLPVPTSFLIDTEGRLAAIYKGEVAPATVVADVGKLLLEGAELRAASLPFPGRWVSKGLPSFRPFTLAAELLDSGFLSEAAEYLERQRATLEADPEYAVLLASFGNAFLRAGDADAAIRHFQTALDNAPEMAVAHLNLGITYNRTGDGEAAESALRRALELEPQNALARRELALNLQNRDRVDEAVSLLRQVLEQDPGDLASMVLLSRALLETDAEEALRTAERADETSGGGHPEILATLADAQHAAGQTAEAIATAGRALSLAEQGGRDKLGAQLQAKIDAWRGR